ncbi:MAG: hypothetical protein M3R03_06675 [Pseudomonadota bacterium]|nr:hypothetical protein [Pseudomonadota bacterium]
MIFVLAIIAMGIIGGILKARYGHREDRDRGLAVQDDGETRRLKEEVSALKERLQVLERITIEKESSLNREIEQLRDRT